MAAQPTTTGTAGERQDTMSSTQYPTLTGDVLVDRAAWKAAGCPNDHPYMVACREAVAAPSAPVEPLAITLTAAQAEYMRAYSPVADAQSRANIAAMLATGR